MARARRLKSRGGKIPKLFRRRPRTVDYEAILAAENLAPIDEPEGRLCRACGVTPVRRLARPDRRDGVTRTAFCQRCSDGEDQIPVAFDRGRSLGITTGALERKQRRLAQCIDEGTVLHERAQALLWSGELSGEAFNAWSLFVVEGLSQNEIARRMGIHWSTVRDRYLGPLKERCGYPVTFTRLRRKRRKRNNRAAVPKQ